MTVIATQPKSRTTCDQPPPPAARITAAVASSISADRATNPPLSASDSMALDSAILPSICPAPRRRISSGRKRSAPKSSRLFNSAPASTANRPCAHSAEQTPGAGQDHRRFYLFKLDLLFVKFVSLRRARYVWRIQSQPRKLFIFSRVRRISSLFGNSPTVSGEREFIEKNCARPPKAHELPGRPEDPGRRCAELQLAKDEEGRLSGLLQSNSPSDF